MTGRPEALFPLFAGLETLEGVGPKTAQNFAQLGVAAPRDLVFTLPYSGIDRRLRETAQCASEHSSHALPERTGPGRGHGGDSRRAAIDGKGVRNHN